MPENVYEVILDSTVFPDKVDVTLANDEWCDTRGYVSEELYKSVDEANDFWQAENAKLRESLERAAGIIADICGECPVSRYEWLSSDGCAEKCGTVTEEECWIAYLTGKRWDESGVEVN